MRLTGACAALVLLVGAVSGCTSTISGHPSSSGASAPGSGSPSTSGSGSDTPPAASPTVAKANFTDCSNNYNLSALGLAPDVLAQLTFDCATVQVPLNYSAPNGSKIGIALVRIHDKTVKPIGSLLVNPGGPGASGVDTALGLTPQLDNTLLKHFDLIGFDPRGVGSSAPITCLSDSQKDALNAASPDMRTAAGFASAKRTAAAIAKACNDKYGAKLADFTTVATARDMDLIRQAVGDDKMNYLGFSYGTELGAQYAHLFPTHIRVAVLDGAVDPLTDDITSFADQLVGFEGAFDQFAAYCVKTAPCSGLANPRTIAESLVTKAMASPIANASDSARPATGSLVDTGILSALYSKSDWPTLGTALIDAQKGNGAGLVNLADQYNERYNGHYTNIAEANTTISCNDSKPGPTDATITATTTSWVKRFPLFGLSSAASLFSCQQWQSTRTVPPLPTATNASEKILVIGNLHDPATPYQGAKDLTKTLGDAELLSWDGEGHTSYLEGSSCIDNDVNAYLISQKLPAVDTTCPAS